MICVDSIRPPGKLGRWPFCHLFDDAGDASALHAFARRLGLRRGSSSVNRGVLTYFPGKVMRDRAIANGANAVLGDVYERLLEPEPPSDGRCRCPGNRRGRGSRCKCGLPR